jgi:hypothetical protein
VRLQTGFGCVTRVIKHFSTAHDKTLQFIITPTVMSTVTSAIPLFGSSFQLCFLTVACLMYSNSNSNSNSGSLTDYNWSCFIASEHGPHRKCLFRYCWGHWLLRKHPFFQESYKLLLSGRCLSTGLHAAMWNKQNPKIIQSHNFCPGYEPATWLTVDVLLCIYARFYMSMWWCVMFGERV